MIARIRKSIEEKDKGFTLIELLVVMIIIGILAAIAIPVFLNQRKKANDTAATSDVSTLGKEVATYYVDATVPLSGVSVSGGKLYVGGTGADNIVGNASKTTTAATLSGSTTDVVAASTDWCVTLTYSGGTRTQVFYSAANGLSTTGCTTAPAGGGAGS